MLARAAERWYDVHTRALRRHDPGRLIFGDKLHSPHTIPHWLLDTVRRHVDVLLIQWYKPFAEQRGALIELHRRLGKPILNGDSGFACLKPPHQTEVKGYRVADLVSVGRSYTEYLDGIMSLPFMIGWHHCGFMEQWDGGKRSEHGELSENGLMDPFERPHEPVVRAVRQANLRAAALHAESARRVGI